MHSQGDLQDYGRGRTDGTLGLSNSRLEGLAHQLNGKPQYDRAFFL